MTIASIDTSELEYLKSCRDKLRDISDILKDKEKDEKELPAEPRTRTSSVRDKEKLQEIKKILKG